MLLCFQLFLSFARTLLHFLYDSMSPRRIMRWQTLFSLSLSFGNRQSLLEISRRTTKEDVGGLLLSLVRCSRFDAGTQTSASALSAQPLRGISRGKCERFIPASSPLDEILTGTSCRVASSDEWTRAKTRTQQSG